MLVSGSLCVRVFRHIGVGFPPRPRLSTRWQVLDFLRLLRWVVGCHFVWFAAGSLRRPAARVVIRSRLCEGWARRVILWSTWLSWGKFQRFRQWDSRVIWRGCVEEGGGC